MELLFILAIVGFFIIRSYFSNNKSKRLHRVTNKHGHRCYVEDLSYAEKVVSDTLARSLNHQDYFIFNNLILPTENGGSTQIDHVVVSRFGIFVIESKDFGGWIFGSSHNEKWTQSLPGGKKYPFYNPLRQNHAHVLALKKQLPFIEENIYSIVVFSNRCEFKTPRINNVLYLDELVSYIDRKKDQVLSNGSFMLAIGRLSYMCQAVDISSAQHIENVKATIEAKNTGSTYIKPLISN